MLRLVIQRVTIGHQNGSTTHHRPQKKRASRACLEKPVHVRNVNHVTVTFHGLVRCHGPSWQMTAGYHHRFPVTQNSPAPVPVPYLENPRRLFQNELLVPSPRVWIRTCVIMMLPRQPTHLKTSSSSLTDPAALPPAQQAIHRELHRAYGPLLRRSTSLGEHHKKP